MFRLVLLALVVSSCLLGAPTQPNDLQREDILINARERMDCRRDALHGAANRVRKRAESKRGERIARSPRRVPQRPPVRRLTK